MIRRKMIYKKIRMIRRKTRFRRRKIIWRRKKGRSDGRREREEKDNIRKAR